MHGRTKAAVVTALLVGSAGCATGDLPGHYWVTVTSDKDQCNNPPVEYSETFEYRGVFSASAVEIYIDEHLFATGFINGCEVQYSTVTYATEHDGYEVRWALTGNATVDRDDGCGTESDWVGVETIQIVDSTDPELANGCEYFATLSGKYLGEVE